MWASYDSQPLYISDYIFWSLNRYVIQNRLWSEFVIWLTCLSYVVGAYKLFVLCIVGTNTKDRVKFRIHKQVTDLFSALDVVKQITSITIEPGIEDKFNTSES